MIKSQGNPTDLTGMLFFRANCFMSTDCSRDRMRVVFMARNRSGSDTWMFCAMFQVRYTMATMDWYRWLLFHSYLSMAATYCLDRGAH